MPILGITMPNMSRDPAQPVHRPPTGLADALFPSTRQRVLACLFGRPGRSFYATELMQLTGGGSGAVQRELARLAQSGLATVRRKGHAFTKRTLSQPKIWLIGKESDLAIE